MDMKLQSPDPSNVRLSSRYCMRSLFPHCRRCLHTPLRRISHYPYLVERLSVTRLTTPSDPNELQLHSS
jgi:hypothetical protein